MSGKLKKHFLKSKSRTQSEVSIKHLSDPIGTPKRVSDTFLGFNKAFKRPYRYKQNVTDFYKKCTSMDSYPKNVSTIINFINSLS